MMAGAYPPRNTSSCGMPAAQAYCGVCHTHALGHLGSGQGGLMASVVLFLSVCFWFVHDKPYEKVLRSGPVARVQCQW